MSGSARTITDWLRALGLANHAAAFAENRIDFDVLPDLTDEDLRDLGVTALGNRKRLARAIADLGKPGVSAPAAPAPQSERRQVTVLFADISGYTKLSQDLDPEETLALLNGFFVAADAVIKRYGGTVDKHIGDAVMAVFGAPIAHSDDPLRAVRAAIDIHQASAALDPPLGVHIGVASGEVVASGTGSDDHREYTVTGASVNLASRLHDLAGRGQTFVSGAVHDAIGAAVDAEAEGGTEIAGFDGTVPVWSIRGLSDHHHATPRLIGRRRERRQFEAAVEACLETKRGEVIYVRGEPGLGKTRLGEAFRAMAEERGFACHAAQALDFGSSAGGGPTGTLARSLLGASPGNETDAIAANVAREHWDTALAVHVSVLLDLPLTEAQRSIHDAMDHATRMRGREAALAGLVAEAAAQTPLMILLEDLHWAEDTLLNDVRALSEAIGAQPVVLVLTTRLGGDPVNEGRLRLSPDVPIVTLDLAPLPAQEARALAAEIGFDDADVVARSVARSGGNPLFLEQLLRAGAPEEDGGAVPGTIQSVVQARLDALAAHDRDALQAASVLGQRFSLDAMRHLIGRADFDPGELVRRALIRRDGDDLMFAHALVLDGIYRTLLKSRRIALHQSAAAWYRDNDPVLFARHLDKAQAPEAAGAYFDAAAMLVAARRPAEALDLAARAAELAQDRRGRWAAQQQRADILLSLERCREAVDAYRTALAEAEGETEAIAGQIGIAAAARLSGDVAAGIAALDDAEPRAQALGASRDLAQINYYRGAFLFQQGDIEGCTRAQERAVAEAEEADDPEWIARGLSGLGDARYANADIGRALAAFERCIAVCEEHGLGRIAVANRYMVGNMLRYHNRFDEALALAPESIALTRTVGDHRALAFGLMLYGEYLTDAARYADGMALFDEALALGDMLNNDRIRMHLVYRQGRSIGLSDDPAQGLEVLAKAQALSEAVDPRFLGSRIEAARALFLTGDAQRAALARGEDILRSGVISHNHLEFNRDAIDACARTARWDDAERYAATLRDFTAPHPFPWADFFVARGMALAAAGRGDPDGRALALAAKAEAERIGLLGAVPLIERVL
jgi:class 3 adenylate cyclase/tetratricopeptide (TPR) repeat protein